MALTVSQTTESITRVEEIFLNAVTSAVVFSPDSGVRQIAGVADKFSMYELDTNTNIVQSYATAPSETGDATLGDTNYPIAKKSINFPVPYQLFANTEFKESIENIHEMGIEPRLQEAMVRNIADKAMRETEKDIVNGNDGAVGSPTSTNDGWNALIQAKLTAASLTAQILTGTDDPGTVSQIQGILTSMVAVMPTALLNDPEEVYFHMSPAAKFAYQRSLETQNQAVLPQSADRFGTIGIKVIPNMNTNTIILGKTTNLAVGTPSAVGDMVSLEVIDQKTNLKNQANIFGNFGYGSGVVTTDWVTYENTIT